MGIIDHLKHRLNPKTIAKEAFNHLTDKTFPHGADEVGNVLFSGSAYLPRPAVSGPAPIEAPAAEAATPEAAGSDNHASLYGPTEPSPGLDDYMSGYSKKLEQSARRGREPGDGLSR